MKVSEYVSLGHPDKACEYISENMKKAAARLCVPMKCDCEVMRAWNVPTVEVKNNGI